MKSKISAETCVHRFGVQLGLTAHCEQCRATVAQRHVVLLVHQQRCEK